MDAERLSRFYERTELEEKLLEGCSSNVVDFPLRSVASTSAQKAARRRAFLSPGMKRRAVFLLKSAGLFLAFAAFFFAAGFYTTN